MANFDKPAYTWAQFSMTFVNPDTYRDVLDIPSINPDLVPDWQNAFPPLGSAGGNTTASFPI